MSTAMDYGIDVVKFRKHCNDKLDWIEEEIDKLFHQIPVIEEFFESMTGEKLEREGNHCFGVRRLIREEMKKQAELAVDALWCAVFAEEKDLRDYLVQIPQVAVARDRTVAPAIEERRGTIKQQVLDALTEEWSRPAAIAERTGLSETQVRNVFNVTAKPGEFAARQNADGLIEYAVPGTVGSIPEEKSGRNGDGKPDGEKTIRERVFEALALNDWMYVHEISSKAHLTEQQVKSVFYSPSVNGMYAKRVTDSGFQYALPGSQV